MKHLFVAASVGFLFALLQLYSKTPSDFIKAPAIHTGKIPIAQQGNWEILFDGKDLNKWRKTTNDSMPSKGWVIAGNTVAVTPVPKGGDIITRSLYSSFELVFDFKLTKGANSGIKYLVSSIENTTTGHQSMMGIEYQIIDDYNHPEIKEDPNGTSSTAAAYLLYAPVGKKLHEPGQWNTGKIIVKGKHAEHWLNGVLVTSYTRGTEEFEKKVSQTKFKDYPEYAKADIGHIMLTDHGDRVYFRNIKIKRL